MKCYGVGNLYAQLKELEAKLNEYERRVVDYTVNSENPKKEVADKLIEEYRSLKDEYDSWMTRIVYEKEE